MPASLRSRRASRPWCNAAVASRLGMGAILGETPRSLRISSDAPSRIARSAASTSSSSASRRCSPGVVRVGAGNNAGSVATLKSLARDRPQPLDVLVGEDRVRQLQLAAVLGRLRPAGSAACR